MSDFFSWKNENLILQVKVHAGAKREEIKGPHMGCLKIAVTRPPVDGKANKQVCQLLARELNIAVSHVQILKGHGSSRKRILIEKPTRIPKWLTDAKKN